jgi:hypothetical protein
MKALKYKEIIPGHEKMFPYERNNVPGKEKCSFTSKTTFLESKHSPRPGKHRL